MKAKSNNNQFLSNLMSVGFNELELRFIAESVKVREPEFNKQTTLYNNMNTSMRKMVYGN